MSVAITRKRAHQLLPGDWLVASQVRVEAVERDRGRPTVLRVHTDDGWRRMGWDEVVEVIEGP